MQNNNGIQNNNNNNGSNAVDINDYYVLRQAQDDLS